VVQEAVIVELDDADEEDLRTFVSGDSMVDSVAVVAPIVKEESNTVKSSSDGVDDVFFDHTK